MDIQPLETVDQVVDLTIIPWPWETSSVDEILAEDFLEHIAFEHCPGQSSIIQLMQEIHRVLKPGGILNAKVPSTDGRGAFQDPTHVTFWNENTFSYFDARMPHNNLYPGLPKFHVLGLTPAYGDPHIVWVRAKLKAVK